MTEQAKISPNDPQLFVPARPRADPLRKGPLVAALVALSVVITGGVLAAELIPDRNASSQAEEAPKFIAAAVPDDILKVPPAPRRPQPEPTPQPELPPLAAGPAALPPPPTPQPATSTNSDPYSRANRRRERLQAYWQARGADIAVNLGPRHAEGDTSSSRLLGTQSAQPAAVPGAGSADDPNMQIRKNAFVNADHGIGGYVHAPLQRPISPYEVKAGTVLPASLITSINSDLPGVVIAQIRENVYDWATGAHLLIPQGARLIASYDSMVAWGQERVLICWSRLIFPNGNEQPLGCMPGADLTGSSGLTDEVDEHWWRLIRGASIAALLSGATSAAGGSTTGFQPSLPQLWARGAASETASAGSQLTERNMRVQPTIRVRQGWSMNVIVTQNIILEPYTEEAPSFEQAPSGAAQLGR